MAMSILKHACSTGEVVHIVCDTYPNGPTIEDIEHDLRGESSTSYRITGSSQKRPPDLNTAWSSSQFKKEFLAFLKNEWTLDAYAEILEGHFLYYAVEQECYCYSSENGTVNRNQIHELQCVHEEADTRLLYHANFVAEKYGEVPVIVIRSNDTDVFILILHHARFMNAQLWMDAGVN